MRRQRRVPARGRNDQDGGSRRVEGSGEGERGGPATVGSSGGDSPAIGGGAHEYCPGK